MSYYSGSYDSGVSGAAIAGMVIGIILGIAFWTTIIWLICRCARRRDAQRGGTLPMHRQPTSVPGSRGGGAPQGYGNPYTAVSAGAVPMGPSPSSDIAGSEMKPATNETTPASTAHHGAAMA